VAADDAGADGGGATFVAAWASEALAARVVVYSVRSVASRTWESVRLACGWTTSTRPGLEGCGRSSMGDEGGVVVVVVVVVVEKEES
jgi:hypothetical protein